MAKFKAVQQGLTEKLSATQQRLRMKESSSRLLAVAELVIGLIGKGIINTDLVALIDSLSKIFSKGFTDNAFSSDVSAKALTKQFNDVVMTSDLVVPLLGQATLEFDSGLVTDVQFFEVGKNPFDSAGMSDEIEFENAFQRNIGDSSQTSDEIILAASYSRTASEITALADQVALLVGIFVSDTMSAVEACILLNQGYIDNNLYFADDYVGLKRIF